MKNIIKQWTAKILGFIPIKPVNEVIEKGSAAIELQFIIGARNGLYLYTNGILKRLLDGHFYGISENNGRWYAHQRRKFWDRIVSFQIEQGRLVDPKEEITGLALGCHQIDFIDSQLYVSDTYNNRIQVYKKDDKRFRLADEFFPAGRLDRGRSSKNYVHINSIWANNEGVFLLFHNETSKTQRYSEIVKLNNQNEIIEKIRTQTANAHNVIKINDDFLVCNSMNSSLYYGEKEVFRANMLTKGLAVSDRFIVVGGSEFGKRKERDKLTGEVYILNRSYDLLKTIKIPGSVSEVRLISEVDYGLSNNTQHLEIKNELERKV